MSEMNALHQKDLGRFLILQDGLECILEYELTGNELISFTHTRVPPELRGRGYAAALMHAGCDYARRNGLRIIAVCAYARSFMQRHVSRYGDLLEGTDGKAPVCKFD